MLALRNRSSLGVLALDLSSNLHNVKIVIKPDLSDISLHVINTCCLTSETNGILCPQYHIFEDHTHVSEVYVNSNKSQIFIR